MHRVFREHCVYTWSFFDDSVKPGWEEKYTQVLQTWLAPYQCFIGSEWTAWGIVNTCSQWWHISGACSCSLVHSVTQLIAQNCSHCSLSCPPVSVAADRVGEQKCEDRWRSPDLQLHCSWISAELSASGKHECQAYQGLGKGDESIPLPDSRYGRSVCSHRQ